ncbi:MAG: tetratricopeptide repeat protein, partial [Nitrososphaerota archaeon]
MDSSHDIVLNQLYLVNGLIKRLIENQGIKTELDPSQKPELSFDSKSKIASMLKVQDRLQNKLPKQQQRQSIDKNLELLVGNFYFYDKQYGKAINFYEKSLKSNPQDISSLINKGITTSKLGNHKEAIALYDRVLEIDPKYFDALHCKGDSLALLSKHGEALSCYEQTLQIDPNYLDGLYKKGLALFNLANYEEAISYFDKALN